MNIYLVHCESCWTLRDLGLLLKHDFVILSIIMFVDQTDFFQTMDGIGKANGNLRGMNQKHRKQCEFMETHYNSIPSGYTYHMSTRARHLSSYWRLEPFLLVFSICLHDAVDIFIICTSVWVYSVRQTLLKLCFTGLCDIVVQFDLPCMVKHYTNACSKVTFGLCFEKYTMKCNMHMFRVASTATTWTATLSDNSEPNAS